MHTVEWWEEQKLEDHTGNLEEKQQWQDWVMFEGL